MVIRSQTAGSKEPGFTFFPDFICKSITDVDFGYLKKQGIKACFIDLDGTVVSRGTFEVDPRIGEVLSNSKLDIHIATNRPKSKSLKRLKEDLYAVSVVHPRGLFGKPTKRYYKNALKELHLKPQEVVMLGDRYVQDILGANRAGIYSLVVYKLGDNKGKFDKSFSNLEKVFTNFIVRKYRTIVK